MGAILSQKLERQEQFVAYDSKGLSPMQKCFHPMEGECYTLVWVIMHFLQYIHHIIIFVEDRSQTI